MKAYFAEGTPSSTLAEARDELLFFIRTTMASGAYESVEVRKVIYIEDLSVGDIHSNPPPNAQNVLVWEEEGNGNGSSVLTSILVVLGMIFLGLLGFLFISRRTRRRGSGRVPTQQPPQSLSEIDSIAQGVEENSVESVWQKALDAYGNVVNTDTGIPDPNSATFTNSNSNPNFTIGDESKDSSASIDPEGFVFRPASTSTVTENTALECGAMEEETTLICKTTEELQTHEQEQSTDTHIDERDVKDKDVEEDDSHVSNGDGDGDDDDDDDDDQLEPC